MSIDYLTTGNQILPNKPNEGDWEGMKKWMTGMMIAIQDFQRSMSIDLASINTAVNNIDTRLTTAEGEIDDLQLQLRRSFLL